jgi:hypothetical protein
MTVNLNRKVGVSSAALGGYSARQLPAATSYGVRYETLTLRPTIDDTTWQVADQNATLYNLTNTDLATGTYLSTYEGSIQYSGTGGPGSGTPKMRVTPLGWRSLGYQGSIVIPGIGAGGITLESWIDFGPRPSVTYGNDKLAVFRCGLGPQSAGIDYSDFFNPPTIATPSIAMTAYALSSLETSFSYVSISCEYGALTIEKTLLTGIEVSGAGWNHYACEVTYAGLIAMYFNGEPLDLDPGLEDVLRFGEEESIVGVLPDLDSFLPYAGGTDTNWINSETANPTTWQYIDVAGVRYTKGLRYNGESFSPPAV